MKTCDETLCGPNNTLKFNGTCDGDTGNCVYEIVTCENGCGYLDEENTSLGYACIGSETETVNETEAVVNEISVNGTVEEPCPGMAESCAVFPGRILDPETCQCVLADKQAGSVTQDSELPETNAGMNLSSITGLFAGIPSEVLNGAGIGVLVVAIVLVLIVFFFTGGEEPDRDVSGFDEFFKKRKEPSFKNKKMPDSEISRGVEKKIYEEDDVEEVPQTEFGKKVYRG